ncbi:uncharacterized protein Tco025E_09662 [Trypanosoma conorhini]|uniref:Trans-sialidase C-terminal domain-containing protein n=1 Tax=Trypanosoma conorhini TaxID=83891 RepID=A0A3R7M5Y2_9TRYP|nr:uncharacterized protein Tco025E_09662 [Trypanosoma conorhini]RNE96759.1 hypothetical protein Tco025E_09662 [Trypanosoma conorhini]
MKKRCNYVIYCSTVTFTEDEDACVTWEPNAPVRVAPQLQQGECCFDDGGKNTTYRNGCNGTLLTSKRASHLYFGGEGAEGAEPSHRVAEANVLLHNRVLTCG